MTPSPSEPRPAPRFAIALSFAGACILLPLVLFQALHPRSMAWQVNWPAGLRRMMLAQEFALAILACLSLAALASLPLRRRSDGPAPLRLLPLLCLPFVLGLCASVMFFLSEGRYRTWESYRFFWTQPGPFFAHLMEISPGIVVHLATYALVMVAYGTLLALLVPRLSRRVHLAHFAALLVLLAAAAFYAPWRVTLGLRDERPWFDAEAGEVQRVSDVTEETYRLRVGPFATLGLSIAAMYETDPSLRVDPTLNAAGPPRADAQRWQGRIDPATRRDWNVLVILVESLRDDILRGDGGENTVMPRLQAFANRSLHFRDHLSACSHSNYADLVPLNSHHPLRGRQTHVYPRDPAYPRLPLHEILAPLGYRTGIVSSQDENWGGMLHYLRTPGLGFFFHAPDYRGERQVEEGDVGFAGLARARGKSSGKVDDAITVFEALQWIEAEPHSPFFLYLNLQNSHFPYRVPPGAPRPYSVGLERPEVPFSVWPMDQVDTMRRFYLDSLRYTDAQLGRLFDALERAGQLDRTLVAVTGGTGESFMEHGFATHANRLFQEQIHTPLILHVPGLAPAVLSTPSSHVDIPPTLFGQLGLPPHPSFQGADLLDPALPAVRSRFAVAQSPLAREIAIVHGRYKLRRSLDPDPAVFLYDLAADPRETREIAAERPEIAAALRLRLDTWASAQFGYYRDSRRQRRFFPPRLDDPPIPGTAP